MLFFFTTMAQGLHYKYLAEGHLKIYKAKLVVRQGRKATGLLKKAGLPEI